LSLKVGNGPHLTGQREIPAGSRGEESTAGKIPERFFNANYLVVWIRVAITACGKTLNSGYSHLVPEHKLQALVKLGDRFESREQLTVEKSVVSDELKQEIEKDLDPKLDKNRNVYPVRQGRGLKIASDIRRLNVARDGIEPPTRAHKEKNKK